MSEELYKGYGCTCGCQHEYGNPASDLPHTPIAIQWTKYGTMIVVPVQPIWKPDEIYRLDKENAMPRTEG